MMALLETITRLSLHVLREQSFEASNKAQICEIFKFQSSASDWALVSTKALRERKFKIHVGRTRSSSKAGL